MKKEEYLVWVDESGRIVGKIDALNEYFCAFEAVKVAYGKIVEDYDEISNDIAGIRAQLVFLKKAPVDIGEC